MQGSNWPNIERYVYALSFKANVREHTFTFEGNYRPDTVRLRVEERGLHFIDAIYLNDSQTLTMNAFDCYEWSIKHQQEVLAAFEKEHGLVGMSLRDQHAYYDEHGLSPPDPGKVPFPTLRKGDKLRFVGRFSSDVYGALVGFYEPESE